ncbi:hypothetical protein BDZ45DRAFT_501816 [Acephala macrosclerotiorum]|nr:hypothetical protein BDZ45DRAFT_501816 [Acephala macrosclerotiorum]
MCSPGMACREVQIYQIRLPLHDHQTWRVGSFQRGVQPGTCGDIWVRAHWVSVCLANVCKGLMGGFASIISCPLSAIVPSEAWGKFKVKGEKARLTTSACYPEPRHSEASQLLSLFLIIDHVTQLYNPAEFKLPGHGNVGAHLEELLPRALLSLKHSCCGVSYHVQISTFAPIPE